VRITAFQLGRTPRTAITLIWLISSACAPNLSNSHRSLEDLIQAALDALERQDQEALWALLVTREEHQDLLWDQLPSRRAFTFDYVRSLNERNSREGIESALREFGGSRFSLVSVEFTEPTEDYEGFRLHLGARVTVKRAGNGVEGVLPIFDVILEYGGRWKLMNYEQ